MRSEAIKERISDILQKWPTDKCEMVKVQKLLGSVETQFLPENRELSLDTFVYALQCINICVDNGFDNGSCNVLIMDIRIMDTYCNVSRNNDSR